ncbi:alkaline phosphatase [Anaeromicrobium sediminis]|uniref:Alkaline phosphatase n=1 Tax=Anaeromicrobium sediminis TaxID=1478221 RepID=A0A267MLF0_9FIRM|nr:alkaline phosphatase [Anaeromicrobium sediminis]PAB59600.1 alkaline phosphatase [Anaeromicrobium sediminis]
MFKKKNFTTKALIGILLLAFVFVSVGKISNNKVLASEKTFVKGKAPKYVFYFIGDGLGAAQRQAGEYYVHETTGNKEFKLNMNTLPKVGINTTHSADSLVTDSAAAGTALATGNKTNNGVISKLPDGTDVKTLIEEAETKGMATGIVTSTRLTHATPATFASHNISRGNENEIAVDYLDSGVDFFAGGGYRNFIPQSEEGSKRKDDRNLVEEFKNQGYKTFIGKESTKEFRDFKASDESKVFASFTSSHLPYEVDRKNTNETPALAEIIDTAIETLSKDEDGFFLMVEGGRIDHAGHANDLAGVIHDVLAFDEAINEALDFYKEHKDETLIVVVGDHETGGMGLGFGKNYFLKFDQLKYVKVSVEDTLQKIYNGNREEYLKYIEENFALNDLNEEELKELNKAMDLVDNGQKDEKTYGYYNPVATATTHILSKRANAYWTTFAHSGTQIPMSAIGVNAEAFEGFKDNIEIAKTMAEIMKFQLTEVNKAQ